VEGRLPPLKRFLYRRVLKLARRYAPLRTERDEAVLLCGLLERDVILDVGRRLYAAGLAHSSEEARFLTAEEIVDWLEGTWPRDDLVRALHERGGLERRWRRYAPPDVLHPAVEDDAAAVELDAMPEDTLTGRAISAGQAQGRARVIITLGEATNVAPGDILICRQPGFELSPLFGMVGAVVAEEGGLLDHAAVLVREYGVPAVFGVERVTQVIRDGEDLLVDATRGVVVRKRSEQEWELWR
jgi:rifampicin phosphotransferase